MMPRVNKGHLFIYFYFIMIDHRSYAVVVKLKPEKTSGLNGIRTHDLCDTGAVLYQVSYQANWELVTLVIITTIMKNSLLKGN